jgi:hypothetical protein
MRVTVSLLCALLAAVSYGVGSVLQSVAASRTERRPNLDAMLLARLLRQLPYVGGLALDLLGFIAAVVALRNLPLFMVQSAVAGSIGVTAVVASVVFATKLRQAEKTALVVLFAGLVLLASASRAERATALSGPGRWLLAAGIAVTLAIGFVAARLTD